MNQVVRGSGLRTRLLIGVAAAAIAAPAANRALADSGAKWSPYVEAGGMAGTHSFGDVDIFIPVWQDQTSILFGDLRGTFSAQPTEEGNFGLGYRTQVSPEWILGGYGYFDIQNSPNDNLFYQITLGVELKSVDWDFRLNGYIPINAGGQTVNKNSNPQIHIAGNTIQMTTESRDEKALYGFDGEVGWRLPFFPADGNFDLRVYAGGYFFTNSDVDTIAGPRGRIEARLYDIDFLGLQSRLTAQGVIQWDAPRGMQGFGGLELRIPLGAITGSPGPKLNPLDRRMVDRVQRDIDVVTEKTDPKKTSEDVIVDELTVSTHTIVFANSGGAGSGAKGSPIDLNAAPGLAPGLNGGTGSNAIILADGGAGSIAINQPLQLLPGQALIGGGSVVPLTGVHSGKTVDFLFSGSRPTLTGSDSGKDLIHMYSGSQNRITGLDVAGTFANAIFGLNMERAVITDNNIDPPVSNGIFLQNSGAGIPVSQFVDIRSNSIADAAGFAGIALKTYLSDGLAHTQTISITNNSITGASGNGIAVFDSVASVPSFARSLLIAGNSIISAGGNGIFVDDAFTSIAGALYSGLAITGNAITSAGGDGIFVDVVGHGVGSFSETVAASGNTIGDVNGDGIFFDEVMASVAGAVNSRLAFNGNAITSANGDGISLDFDAFSVGSVSRAITAYGNTIAVVSGNGIFLDELADVVTGGVVRNLAFDGNSITNATSSGIFIILDAVSVGSVSQSATVDNNTIANVNGDGIFFDDVADIVTGRLARNLAFDGNSITNATSSGIHILLDALSVGSISQTVTADNNAIADVNGDGIFFDDIFDVVGGAASSSLAFDGNSIANAGGRGISITLDAVSVGSLTQAATADDNTITHVNGIGIFLDETADVVTGAVSSSLAFNSNAITSANGDGIFLDFTAVSVGSLTQAVAVDSNTITSAAADGIHFIGTAVDVTGAANQSLAFDDNAITSIGANGIDVAFSAVSLGSFSQAVTVGGNSIGSAPANGVNISEAVTDVTGGASQSVSFYSNAVASAGGNGLQLIVNAVSLGSFSQAVAAEGNSIGSAGANGINFVETATSVTAGVSQSVSFYKNGIASAGANGIAMNFTGVSFASFSQAVAVDNNTIGTAGANGIDVVETVVSVAQAFDSSLSFDGNAITSAGANGIELVFTGVSFGSFTHGVTIGGNTIGRVGANGINLVETDNNVTGPVSQSFAFDGNSLSSAGANGMNLIITESNFGSLSQAVSVDGNTFGNVGANGVFFLENVANVTGAVNLSQAFDDNSVATAGGAGIDASFIGVSFGSFSQAVAMSGNGIGSAAANGLAFNDTVTNVTGAASVSLSFYDNRVTSAAANGIGVVFTGVSLGSLSQAIDLANNTITRADANGIAVSNTLTTIGNPANASLTITGNHVASAGAAGLYVQQIVDSATVVQSLAIDGNSVAHVGKNGIASKLNVGAAGSFTQTGTVNSNFVTAAGINGLFFSAAAGGATSLDLSLSGNTISGNTKNGFAGLANGAGVTETFTMVTGSGNHINGNGGVGVYLSNAAGAITFHINSNDLAGNTGGATAGVGGAIFTP